MLSGFRTVHGAVALAVLGAVAVYALADNEAVKNVCYLGVLAGAGLGAWVGALRVPRGRRLVPILVASGISLSALGDVLWTVLDAIGSGTDVSIADPAWFVSYVTLAVALWLVLDRSRPSGVVERGRAELNLTLDVATIVAVSVLVFWSLTVDAIVADQTVTPFVRAVWAAYPVADAVLLALVVRVLMSRRARADVGTSFAVGVGLWLVADVGYLQVADGSNSGVVLDALWMVAPVLLARAAWGAGRSDSRAREPERRGAATGQLILAVAPLFVPAALELLADVRGKQDQPLQLFFGTAVLITLAFIRTARLLSSEDRALRALESARDVAVEASRAKTLFVANMSHEIRTPLTVVLATGELLEDTPLDDVQLGLLTKMNRSGEQLKSLVEGILDFSAIEAGRLTLTSTTFDLHALVAEAADVYRSRALPTPVHFVCDLAPDVPRSVVGDPARLRQVLGNLLDNALKFTHEGQVSLVVRRVASGAAAGVGGGVELAVTDTGIGLRQEDLEAIFTSFHQADGSETRRYGGNGLGLAICKELTERMGGTITVTSEVGVGSTFVVRLPLAPEAPAQVPVPSLPAIPIGPRSTLVGGRFTRAATSRGQVDRGGAQLAGTPHDLPPEANPVERARH
jgi:signal transduction histidine kinase